jgi:hypothetical protein
MLSATYRQSSEPPRDPQRLAIVEQIDPENRLLWRMNPRRLTFEQFRDTLIALSGELDERMGGEGVDVLSSRRSVYLLIDRQYLPNVFNVFDFASPDFHSAQRSETTIPQQALFVLNSTFLADRARKIADKVSTIASTPEGQTTGAYRAILKRDPTPAEVQRTKQFLAVAAASVDTQSANETKAWSYGYGAIDPQSGITKSFHPLPHFTGESWQGGTLWPDSVLGWIKLTAKGGHVGNDHKHAAIRRWTAGSAGTISIKSEIIHQAASGEGVRCWIVASRGGVLKSADVFNGRKRLDVDSLAIEPGDTVDFVVDYGQSLDSDDFVWAPIITQTSPAADAAANPITTTWNSENNFPRVELTPLEQLTQILLVSNDLMFVD